MKPPRHLTTFACELALCAASFACAPASPAAAPATAPDIAVAPTSSVAAAPAASSAPPSEANQPPAASQRPLDLTSDCPHEMHVYYGDHPGDGKGEAKTIAPGAVVPVPRGADGTAVVWVTDDKGSGLASVHVTRRMRHVRIDTACMKIDADSTR